MTRRTDRVLTIVLVAVGLVTFATLMIALLSLPILTSGSDAANATKESGDIAACRSAYNVLVTEASGLLDDASRDVDLLTNEVLQAAYEDDQATIDRALPRIPVARELVARRSLEREQAVALYKAAVKRSGDDPKGFLADCRTHPPI